MAGKNGLLVLTVILLWSVCKADQASPTYGQMRPGFNPNFHQQQPGSAGTPVGTPGSDIVHEHEAQHEASNNGPHQTPEFLHHHYNNHPEVVNPNPTVRLQAIVPATPQIRINPTPTSLNLTQDGGNQGGIRPAQTPPPPRNLSNPDHPEMVIPTEERNQISPRIDEAGQGINVVPKIKSSSEELVLASSTTHLQPSSASLVSRSTSSVSVQSSLGLDLLQNPQSSSHLEASESSLDRLEVTASSMMTPRLLDSKSPTSESICGLLCLMSRPVAASSLTFLKIQSSIMNQVTSASISPTRTDIGSLPTDATGLVINNGRAGPTSQSTRLTDTSSRQSITTPLTLQTAKIPNTTAQRSVASTPSPHFSEILFPMTEIATIATTLKRLPNTLPNVEPTTASTNLPEILIPMTERTTQTSIATTLKRLPITLQNDNSTTASPVRTDFPEILIPLTERASTRPSSRMSTAARTATSTTSQRPTQREATSNRPTTSLSTTTQTVPSTKRSKYIPKGQRTFIFVSQTTSLPFTAPSSSTTASSQASQQQTHHNGSRRRTTLASRTTQRTTVQMGFIGSTTKAPITTTQDIKSMTFPTIQPTNQTTIIIKTEANATTQSPRTLPQDNGSRRRTTAARSSVSSTESTPGLTTTVATVPSQVNTTSSENPSIPTVATSGTHGPAYHVSNATTTPAILIITRAEETIPPVFLTVRLRMSWNTFCVNVRIFQHELVEILEENYQNSFKEEQIMIMNEEIKFCVEFQVVKQTDIFVKLYIVNFEGEYDSSLTVECAQFMETGFQDESFFKDKLVRVTLNTADENIHKENPTPSPALAPWSDPGITIAITIATLGGCCCIGVIILQILVRRRYRKMRILNGVSTRRRFSMTSNDTIALSSIKARPHSGLFNPALDILDITRFINHNGILSNPVNFAGLVNICQDVEVIYEEFYAIKNDMPRLSTVPKGAEDKNRYSNVIPHPKTRVNLKRKVSQVNSEYINANFITGYHEENKAFIATQAPLRNTRDDFWRMVWEQQSRVIVMLNAMDEPGKSKCDNYLPESPDNIVKYGDFTVVLKKKDVTQEYILSTLELKDIENNLIREIKHVWYTSWSHKNLPDPVSLVKFVIEIRQLYEDSGGPLVAHCSPGTGRTGTMLSVDMCTRQYDAEKLVDVLKCVSKMRKERAGVVQTKEQYALIYQALYEYALFVNSPPISAASSVMTLHQIRL